ncbi:hypothetical protein GOBAR_AA08972 [Gossypium barbadense]|uniref:Uncharacterized protein n=1 Tax=Gossypium barbadense TaxID=3634 RepID=A0A2P5Y7X6_GOSBA|nr:hypothetical protein GOBAR_AA08972 [Gossypium barbadense]
MEQLNATVIQDEERLVAKPRPETVVSKSKNEVGQNDPKLMPNAVKFLKELLTNKRKLDEASHVQLNAVCSAILQNKLPNKLKDPGSFTIHCLIGSLHVHNALADLREIVMKNAYESCSNNNKGPIYEERQLQIEELDEWRTQKSRTPNKPKLSQDKLNTSPNQLKVGDKVLLDAVDPRIATPEPNEEIPLTVLSIFPYGIVKVIYPKFGTFKVNNTHLKPYVDKVDSRDEEYKLLAPP